MSMQLPSSNATAPSKAAAKWTANAIGQSVVGQILASKWPLMLAILTTVWTSLQGLGLATAILLGVAVALGLSLSALLVSVAY